MWILSEQPIPDAQPAVIKALKAGSTARTQNEKNHYGLPVLNLVAREFNIT